MWIVPARHPFQERVSKEYGTNGVLNKLFFKVNLWQYKGNTSLTDFGQ